MTARLALLLCLVLLPGTGRQAHGAALLRPMRFSSAPSVLPKVQVCPGLDLTGPVPGLSPLAAPALAPSAAPQLGPTPEVLPQARGPAAAPGISQLSERLSQDGRIDPKALDAAYTGSERIARLAGLLPVPAKSSEYLLGIVRGQAPRQAAEYLDLLVKNRPALRHGENGFIAKELKDLLKTAPESQRAAGLSRRVAAARALLRKGRYAAAMAAIGRIYSGLEQGELARPVYEYFKGEAYKLRTRVQAAGSFFTYLSLRGNQPDASELKRRIEQALARDPESYAGEPLSGEPTRLQRYGDCAVQQLYNHPKLALLKEQMPYPAFLNAVEDVLDDAVRKHGMGDIGKWLVLRELGLDISYGSTPNNAQELVQMLREQGSLALTIRWGDPKIRKGSHAVVLQGALREGPRWRFVVIDSNSKRPQLYSFDELGVLNASGFKSIQAREDDPAALEPEPLRRAINVFYGKHGAVRRRVFRTARWTLAPVNLVRGWLGLDAVEAEGRELVDENLLPWAEAPAELVEAAESGRLPPEAVVATPDGRRFLNRLVVERYKKGLAKSQ